MEFASADSCPLENRYWRSIDQEGGIRLMRQGLCDFGSVESRGISRKGGPLRCPHRPSRMMDFVFEASAVRLVRVAPVMLGDELALGAVRGQGTRALGNDADRTSIPPGAPCVFGLPFVVGTGLNSMGHRRARIVFVERKSGDGRDRVSRDKFPNEHHTSLRRPPYVETQVHLFERLVERYRDAEYACVVELEANQAEVGSPFEQIQLRARGHESFQQRGVDRVVEH